MPTGKTAQDAAKQAPEATPQLVSRTASLSTLDNFGAASRASDADRIKGIEKNRHPSYSYSLRLQSKPIIESLNSHDGFVPQRKAARA
ncbi:hypothetical protein ACFQY0_09540 [Haloferula chungangensis]|uniref:Uncharacterized protein n=1 Tax=Haloferula chungangensis TaxID=1048331 RepID=A0ABW2L8L3_9BACT